MTFFSCISPSSKGNYRRYAKLHNQSLTNPSSCFLDTDQNTPVHEVLTSTIMKISESAWKKQVYQASIVLVGYREDPLFWKNCLLNLKRFCPPEYINLLVIVIDGQEEEDYKMKDPIDNIFSPLVSVSPDVDESWQTISLSSSQSPSHHYRLDESKWNGITIHVFFRPHQGKRHAMKFGFDFVKSQVPNNREIIVMDSDTNIFRTSIPFLIDGFREDLDNGCMTGNLQIFNRKENCLTQIVHARYGYAFLIERGAMSHFGCMNCCSGPFSVYRQDLLTKSLLNDFLTQSFCGITPIGPGDDRHLTNLIMMEGYRSRQHPLAIVTTETPVQLLRYIQQQLRWTRSFYREQIYQIYATGSQSWFLTMVTTWELCLPFFIMIGFFPFFQPSLVTYVRRIFLSILISTLKTSCLLGITRGRKEYMFNVFILPMYFFLLLPVKLYGCVTCCRQHWITSTRNHRHWNCSGDMVGLGLVLLVWYGLFLFSGVWFWKNHSTELLSFSHFFSQVFSIQFFSF